MTEIRNSRLPQPHDASGDISDNTDTVKLHKYIAMSGITSRRKAETLISEGLVMVNGKIITNIAERIDPKTARVILDGKQIRPVQKYKAFLLYKPRLCVSTLSDPEGRPTVQQFFPKTSLRLFPVGRLDYDTEGAMIITNDGALAQAISHPSRHIRKTYFVKIKGEVSTQMLRSFDRRPVIDGKRTQQIGLKLIRNINDKTWIEVVLQEGMNRQIKKMFAQLGFPVLKIKRIAIGPPINPYIFKETSKPTSATDAKSQQEAGVAKTAGKIPVQKNEPAAKPAETETLTADKIEQTEISKFIGLIVKLENGVDKGAVSEQDVHTMMGLFQDKLESVTLRDKKILENSLAYKEMQIGEGRNFEEHASEKLINGSEEERQAVFNFLKSKEFISILKDEALEVPTFNPREMKTPAPSKELS
ncbi:hypothetical protein CHS0354_026827 [Potamilus streckersoni]|uniref:RNA-binding S4 domain-containing protein n=1 Tax=Potamilus streckersoni TaxID=2493646 RepID=A0AAE0T5A4_9BIVA|nr:hypothetical protein CHS0354_026827 [Potamilus streckersoni]